MEFISDLDIRILDFSQSMDVEINELFAAARDKMETQGLFSREAYFEAIDEFSLGLALIIASIILVSVVVEKYHQPSKKRR